VLSARAGFLRSCPRQRLVAAGFEHSVANMYFVPLSLLVATFDPAFIAASGLEDKPRR
jgi:formate/nitrite transporter FocA (FNT family)